MKGFAVKAVIVWLILAGCQSLTTQRSVDAENRFHSTRFPAVSISIDPALRYIGSLKHSKYQRYKNSPGGSTSHFHSFLFGLKSPADRFQRGVIIRTKKLSEGYILPDLFDKVRHRLDSGITSFGGQKYQYVIAPSKRPFFDFEENYLFEKGYVLSDAFVAKAFSRREGRGDNYSILIMYIESLDSFSGGRTRFRDWTRREYLSEEQKQFLITLGETCDRCVVVGPITDGK
jgi:hypothetical protein